MSALLYDPTTRSHVLLLNQGAWAGKRWSVELRVCDNPCCGCFHVDFQCIPADAGPDSRAVSVNFVLDTKRRSIYRAVGRKNPAISVSLAKAFVRELDEAG